MPSAPPLREGVGASRVQLTRGPWRTVLEFLDARFPDVGPAAWLSRFERGLVLDDDGTHINADAAHVEGRVIHYYRELPSETPIPFEAEVLFRDDHLLVADKPHFLPVMPAGRYVQQTLLVRLKQQFDLPQLVPLHRIDRDTAGLVLFSSNAQSRARYQALFAQRAIEKIYEALAPALPAENFPLTRCSRLVVGEPFFRMREIDGTPNSETQISVMQTQGTLARYRLQPITGKKHQLRVHMAALGAGLVNDVLYPTLRSAAEDDFSAPLKLLARGLRFTDPLNGSTHFFESRRAL